MTASCAIISVLCQRMGMLLHSNVSKLFRRIPKSTELDVVSWIGLYSHSLQSVINRLRLFAHALALVRSLILELCDSRAFALFQSFSIDGQKSGRRLQRERCDLEVLNPGNGNDVVVAVVVGGGRAGIDRYEVEDWAGGEEGAFEGLRLGSGGGQFDAEGWVLACV